ncbi:glycoside hydrolase family 10 protein [Tulasnella calospora MUT 4182]|uniref:Beta-xylanase n=1 Tax=Tulasnella calospora MUT 4182 TaxID=1051891 RepID=A0A0C3QV28_9AGAM|nr:glycoside hydrolase family 10 protein [Tulasnella calospora MUT 4182]
MVLLGNILVLIDTVLLFSSKEFGMITPENYQKWFATEPVRNQFNFTGADYIVKWAHKNGQAVRGHNFVWHSQLPDWLNNGTWDKKTLNSIMVNHIVKMGSHFRGKLYAWDVVNEPYNDDGTWRSTIWHDIIGPEFISTALTTAHAVDPFAKLYINDYNVEGVNAKSDAHYNLAKSLLKKHVPYHGFGIQGHLVVAQLPKDIPQNIARFAGLGLEVAITELDIRMDLPNNAKNATLQANDYKTVVNACVDNRACVGITVWETSDDYSWIPGVFPTQGDALLFDTNKDPKPAYYAVADALKAAKVKSHFNSWP